MVVAGGGRQVNPAFPQGYGAVGALSEGRLQRALNGRGVGAADSVGALQDVSQVPLGRHVAGIHRPGLVANGHRYGKGVRHIRSVGREQLARLLHGQVPYMDAIDKNAGINHIAVHVVTVLLVGRHHLGVVAQKLAVDKGVISEIPPEIACHLRHHDDSQHQYAQHAQSRHGYAHIGAPAGMVRLFASALTSAAGLSGGLSSARLTALPFRPLGWGRRSVDRPGLRLFYGRRFQRLLPGEVIVIDKGVSHG